MKQKQPKKMFLLTGEPSGDQIGADLMDQLYTQESDLQIFAVAGKKMRQKKLELIFAQEQLEVMGFTDVLKASFKLIRLFFILKRKILRIQPDIIVCIDYPSWHLKLAKTLRRKGFRGKIIQYVSPTIWAYKEKRLSLMEKVLDRVLCIFPFETKFYAQSKLKAYYVGNPCLEHLEPPQTKKTYIGLFPGSRKTEIEQNLPLQLETIKRLQKKDSSLRLAISYASTQIKQRIEQMLQDKQMRADLFPGLAKAQELKMAIATSGTVNLELAIRNIPTLVCYQISLFQYFIVKYCLHIKTRFFCIVNVLLNQLVFPEFYGPRLDVQKLTDSATSLLKNPCPLALTKLRKKLTQKKASKLAAYHILQSLKDKNN